MPAHFVVLTYIDAYLEDLGVPKYVTSVTLFLIGASGLVGTILIGRLSSRSVYAALLAASITVVVGFAVHRNDASKHHPQLAFTSCWRRNRPAPDLSGRQQLRIRRRPRQLPCP
ncbi:hypothetical protein [Arthrobacter sp. MW3 TE3886]|uniref:hypothetical protein n=1 Tax=Arthrobacter sp. MW3 TE3886 TaxID=3156254 RepID=UPI0035184384